MKLQLRDFTMVYDDVGQGSPLLFIHGYPLGRALWQPQIEALSQVARVIAPDLRGFGDSPAVAGKASMETYAADCAALLDALEIHEPVTLCGLSMGGYIAFAFWRAHAARVGRLILAATRALPDSAEQQENRLKAAALAEKEGAEAIARAMLPKMLSPKTQAEHPEIIAQTKQIMLNASVTGIVSALLGMRERPDSTPTLATITVPTLIVRGADDAFASAEEVAAMQAAIPGAQLAIIAGAGHLPNLEQPAVFNQAIKQFIGL